MNEVTRILLIAVLCLPVGILAGHSAVYFFNRIPTIWLTDYDDIEKLKENRGKEVEPSGGQRRPGEQRIKSYPYKWLFAGAFVILTMYFAIRNVGFAVPAVIAIWLLLQISIADIKYMIIPDQLAAMLAVTGIGFLPYNGGFRSILMGIVVGFSVMVIIGIPGKIVKRQEIIGFGDAKLCGALGAILGPWGVTYTMIGGSFLAGIVAAIFLITKRYKKGDMTPFGHYLAISALGYMIYRVNTL